MISRSTVTRLVFDYRNGHQCVHLSTVSTSQLWSPLQRASLMLTKNGIVIGITGSLNAQMSKMRTRISRKQISLLAVSSWPDMVALRQCPYVGDCIYHCPITDYSLPLLLWPFTMVGNSVSLHQEVGYGTQRAACLLMSTVTLALNNACGMANLDESLCYWDIIAPGDGFHEKKITRGRPRTGKEWTWMRYEYPVRLTQHWKHWAIMTGNYLKQVDTSWWWWWRRRRRRRRRRCWLAMLACCRVLME